MLWESCDTQIDDAVKSIRAEIGKRKPHQPLNLSAHQLMRERFSAIQVHCGVGRIRCRYKVGCAKLTDNLVAASAQTSGNDCDFATKIHVILRQIRLNSGYSVERRPPKALRKVAAKQIVSCNFMFGEIQFDIFFSGNQRAF